MAHDSTVPGILELLLLALTARRYPTRTQTGQDTAAKLWIVCHERESALYVRPERTK